MAEIERKYLTCENRKGSPRISVDICFNEMCEFLQAKDGVASCKLLVPPPSPKKKDKKRRVK